MPFIPDDLAASLASARQAKKAELAQASSNGRHPVLGCGRYLRDELRSALLQEGLRKIDHFTAVIASLLLIFLASLTRFNMNQPDDITKAEIALGNIIKAED